MVQRVYIVRNADEEPVPITSDEWLAAVDSVAGLRASDLMAVALAGQDNEEVATASLDPGGVEVYSAVERMWLPAFRYVDASGRIAIVGRLEMGDPTSPVWLATAALTRRLDARIVDSDGVEYDPDSGRAK